MIRAPTESMGELLTEVRTKVMPILDDARRLLINLNTITGSIAGGEGTIGRLLTEDRMAIEVETLLTQVNANINTLTPILESLQTTVKNVSALSTHLSGLSSGISQLTQDAGEILTSLQSVMQDLSNTTPQLPKLIENVNTATGDVPILLSQTQQVLAELEQLLRQLQSHWLLGGWRRQGQNGRAYFTAGGYAMSSRFKPSFFSTTGVLGLAVVVMSISDCGPTPKINILDRMQDAWQVTKNFGAVHLSFIVYPGQDSFSARSDCRPQRGPCGNPPVH